MSWLTLVTGLIQIALSLVNFMRDRQQLEAGHAEAIAEGLKEANARIEKARAARRAADAAGLPDNDPNLRD